MKIYLIITNENNDSLSKTLDVTNYSMSDFHKTINAYKDNFDLSFKRIYND